MTATLSDTVYCCYLLRPLNPEWADSWYIGFTDNPVNRISQHNGFKLGGAKKTVRKRPWQMLLFVWGFPSKHSALQFEWGWQNPRKSKLTKAHFGSKRISRGALGRVQVLRQLLTTQPFVRYALCVNFTAETLRREIETKLGSTLPTHTAATTLPLAALLFFTLTKKRETEKWLAETTSVKSVDELVAFSQESEWRFRPFLTVPFLVRSALRKRALNKVTVIYAHCCKRKEDSGDKLLTRCPQCDAFHHVYCLSTAQPMDKCALIPETGHCKVCANVSKWALWVRNTFTLDSSSQRQTEDATDEVMFSQEFSQSFSQSAVLSQCETEPKSALEVDTHLGADLQMHCDSQCDLDKTLVMAQRSDSDSNGSSEDSDSEEQSDSSSEPEVKSLSQRIKLKRLC